VRSPDTRLAAQRTLVLRLRFPGANAISSLSSLSPRSRFSHTDEDDEEDKQNRQQDGDGDTGEGDTHLRPRFLSAHAAALKHPPGHRRTFGCGTRDVFRSSGVICRERQSTARPIPGTSRRSRCQGTFEVGEGRETFVQSGFLEKRPHVRVRPDKAEPTALSDPNESTKEDLEHGTLKRRHTPQVKDDLCRTSVKR